MYAIFKDTVSIQGKDVSIRDVVNPPGMFENGLRVREYTAKDMLPLSGKLIPEFRGRRSIRDMFSKGPTSGITILSPTSQQQDFRGLDGNKASEEPNSQSSILSGNTQPSPRKTELEIPREIGSQRSSTGMKRAQPDKVSPKPLKRSKSGASPVQLKGQKSLMGFFKPKTDFQDTVQGTSLFQTAEYAENQEGGEEKIKQVDTKTSLFAAETGATKATSANADVLGTAESVHDPIVSKESWSKLFTKPPAPQCEGHGEPCKTMVTKKPGVNCGRSFWMCSKPIGPSGEKEKGTEWRCGTFIWCSDWNST